MLHVDGQESCTIHQYHLQSIQSNNSEAQEEGWLQGQCVLPTVCAAVQQVHGGVDMADQLRKAYSWRRNSRKWWLPLFYFMVDISVVNSYILHHDTPHTSKLTIKEFILELATKLMSCDSIRKHPAGVLQQPSLAAPPSAHYCEEHFPSSSEN